LLYFWIYHFYNKEECTGTGIFSHIVSTGGSSAFHPGSVSGKLSKYDFISRKTQVGEILYTPGRLPAGTCPHGGLVQIIEFFLNE